MNTKKYSGPMRFAHRGLVQMAPENTCGAFQAAIDAGYEGIEIDLQLSKDGEIIVVHDSNFTRMTLGHPTGFSNARICEMTWDEIQRMEIPYANHLLSETLPPHTEVESMAIMPNRLMGQEDDSDYIAALAKDGRMAHLMRFADFDAWFATQNTDTLIEIEYKAGGMMPRMLEILDRSPNLNRYILFSGVEAYNAEIQKACRQSGKPKGLRLGANIRYLTDDSKRWVTENDLFEVGLNAECFTDEDVSWLKDHGVHVLSNLGDYPAWWEKLVQLDVLGFKTNYAGAYTAWWQNAIANAPQGK